MSHPTRRTLLATLALAPLAGCMVGGEPPLPHGRVRAVRIDVSPLVAKGLPNWAARAARFAEPAFARAFAPILAPNDSRAPVVTVTIDEILLASWAGGSDDDPLGADVVDTVRARLTTSAVAGLPTLARPMLVTRPAGDSGPWYAADIDDRRLAGLLATLAGWCRREFP